MNAQVGHSFIVCLWHMTQSTQKTLNVKKQDQRQQKATTIDNNNITIDLERTVSNQATGVGKGI